VQLISTCLKSSLASWLVMGWSCEAHASFTCDRTTSQSSAAVSRRREGVMPEDSASSLIPRPNVS